MQIFFAPLKKKVIGKKQLYKTIPCLIAYGDSNAPNADTGMPLLLAPLLHPHGLQLLSIQAQFLLAALHLSRKVLEGKRNTVNWQRPEN